jgi:hypothetical protein
MRRQALAMEATCWVSAVVGKHESWLDYCLDREQTPVCPLGHSPPLCNIETKGECGLGLQVNVLGRSAMQDNVAYVMLPSRPRFLTMIRGKSSHSLVHEVSLE